MRSSSQGLVRRDTGYGHPLRPEYLLTAERTPGSERRGGSAGRGRQRRLLRKWSVPILAELGEHRRFSELRNALGGITPRALALALQELERARLVRREVLPTRPPSTVYRVTARGRRVHDATR